MKKIIYVQKGDVAMDGNDLIFSASTYYAFCDDGTVWVKRPGATDWEPTDMKPLPQD